MRFADLRTRSEEREQLEKDALRAICACWYYNFADSIDAMTDAELEEIIADNSVDCPDCG